MCDMGVCQRYIYICWYRGLDMCLWLSYDRDVCDTAGVVQLIHWASGELLIEDCAYTSVVWAPLALCGISHGY